MGYGELQGAYQLKGHTFNTLGCFNPAKGKGAVSAGCAFPLIDNLNGYLQYFDGYGENLLDYNHHNRSVGIGVIINNWN